MNCLRLAQRGGAAFLLFLSLSWSSWAQEIPDYGVVKTLMGRYCVECHGPANQEGNLRVDQDLPEKWERIEHREEWQEVLRVLVSRQMPPEGSPQPSDEHVGQIVDWITAQAIANSDAKRTRSAPVRRLTRDQYQRTIRDLLGIDLDVSSFPLDPPAGGFDNNSQALSLSPLHMELYIEAATKAIELALVEGERPETIRWRFEMEQGKSDDSYRVSIGEHRPIVNSGNNPVREQFLEVHHASWDKGLNVRDFRVKDSGLYKIRFRAAGRVPMREEVVASARKFLGVQRDERVREKPEHAKYFEEEFVNTLKHFESARCYDYGPPRVKLTRFLDGQPATIAELDVDASLDQPTIYEVETRLTKQQLGFTLEYAYSIPSYLENFWMQGKDEFARPLLFVDWIEIEGPIYDAWPPQSHRKIISSQHDKIRDVEQRARAILRDFMPYVYRRPVTTEEIESKLRLFDPKVAESESFAIAIAPALVATLASPSFLYITEPVEESTENSNTLYVDEFQYANRLSYFLWGTMPDAELLQLAAAAKLRSKAEVTRQIDRMLKDPKAQAFADLFAAQWLGLREVGANPPAVDLYPDYDRHLETSMVGESKAFFMEILRGDRSLLNFVASDFVVINERMARHYGIDNVRGDDFRVVALPNSVHRGGVVTQNSILTITSNGTRTSPVKRGTWILKNLLGTDPGLPVDNVGDIAPKVPGIDRATVRQRLEIHRELPQCARCHSKIDPLGFALENFNAAGQWRDQEGFGYKGRIEANDPKIDASSQMPDGTKINGVRSLQQAMLNKQDLFLRCITEKMYTYALGRELTMEDRPVVNRTLDELRQGEPTLKNLIQSIALSPPFTRRVPVGFDETQPPANSTNNGK